MKDSQRLVFRLYKDIAHSIRGAYSTRNILRLRSWIFGSDTTRPDPARIYPKRAEEILIIADEVLNE